MKYYNDNKLSQGRSMVEMLGVLGIMAMITALGIIAYTQANKMFKVDRVKNDISTIRIHIQSKYLGSGYSQHLSGSIRDFFKKEFIDTGILKTDRTPMGPDTYYVFAGSNKPGNPLYVGVFGLSKDDCETLLLSYQKNSLNRCDSSLVSGSYALVLYF